MKLHATLAGFLLLSTFAFAQIPAYQWAGTYGNSYSQEPHAVATDANDNMYVGGAFYQTNFDLDPGAGNTYVNANASSDAFLMKLNSAGVFQWGFDIGVIFGDIIYDVDCTPGGTVIAVGSYAGNFVYADPGPNGNPFPPGGGNGAEAFAACYDSNGNYLWQYTINGTGAQYFWDVSIDNAGYVYLACEFTNTVIVDAQSSTSFSSVNGSEDMLIIKLTPSGTYVNAWQIGGTYQQQPLAMDIDNLGHVLLTGNMTSTVDFDPSGAAYNLTTSVSQTDMFVASYDTTGAFNWAFQVATGTTLWGEHISCDANGNMFIVGAIEDTADFDPGAGNTTLSSENYGDGYLVSYDSTGALRFAFLVGTPNNIDRIKDVSVDASNNVYVGGQFMGMNDFDPGPGYDTIRTYNFGQTTAAFVAKYSNTGVHQWAFHFQPTTSLGPEAHVEAMDVSSNGNLFISGYVGNDCDFDPVGSSLVSGNNRLTYVAKYGASCPAPNAPTLVTGANVICAGTTNTYMVPNDPNVFSHTWTLPAGWIGSSSTDSIIATANASSGVISVTASNICGTSSATTYSVTVNPLPIVTYTQNPDTFCIPSPVQTLTQGSPAGGIYAGQYIVGNTIDPATLPVDSWYIYYLYTDANGCTGYDSSFVVADVCNGSDSPTASLIEVYPNPIGNTFTISGLNNMQWTGELYSTDGSLVDKVQFQGSQYMYNSAQLASGMYTLKLTSADEVIRIQLVR